MTDSDILCPSCGHSLGFHRYDYGCCEAPLGGLTSKNMCGCPLTIDTYIRNLQLQTDETVKKFWKLETGSKNCMEEIGNSLVLLKLAQKKIEFLELKLKNVRELLDKPKPDVKEAWKEWFGLGYRNEVIKIVNVNEIILELEKDMDNDG